MAAPTPYLSLPRTAREALTHYRSVFGGELQLYSYAEMGRTDGPADAIAHGQLVGPVDISASDAADADTPFRAAGLLFALLGTADADTLTAWFAALADGGEVVSELQARPWGDHDGIVRDRYGVQWLIGYQG